MKTLDQIQLLNNDEKFLEIKKRLVEVHFSLKRLTYRLKTGNLKNEQKNAALWRELETSLYHVNYLMQAMNPEDRDLKYKECLDSLKEYKTLTIPPPFTP